MATAPQAQTQTPKAPEAEKLEAAKPEAAKAEPLEVGSFARLRACHGPIQHPFTLQWFDTDRNHKVEIDSWYVIQVEAGKMEVVKD